MTFDADFLIIGQGLAGTTFAWRALEAGKRIHIVDPALERGSSWVSGGLYGPLAGRKYSTPWRSLEFVAEAETFYRRIEEKIGRKILHSVEMLHAFHNAEARTIFESRTAQFEKHGIHYETLSPDAFPPAFRSEEGGFALDQGGWLDLREYLGSSRERWLREQSLSPEDFAWDGLEEAEEGVRWKGRLYREMVLCTGAELAGFAPLSALPWARTRGELFELRMPGFDETRVLKRKMALIPQGGDRYRWLATYENSPKGSEPTEAGQTELLSQLKETFGEETPEVVAQFSGIRSHVRGHFPVIGRIPDRPHLSVFGALGSKGVLWAPLCSSWLLGEMLEGTPVPAQVGLDRFLALAAI